MYKQKSDSKRSLKPFIILAVIVVLLAGGGLLAWQHYRTGPEAITTRPRNNVDYGPPTKQDKAETDRFKDDQQKDTPAETPPADNGSKGVTPVISYIGQYDASIEASAYVGSVIEDGGSCTLTLKNGATTVIKTVSGVADARTTRCNLFTFAASELRPTGSWTATVSYKSTTASGISQPATFEVR